jgi:hypothetical protein
MLLDIWSVLGGVGLAVVAFIVVILVCVVILRLLAAILPSYEDRGAPASEPDEPTSDDATVAPSAGRVAGTDAVEQTPRTNEQAAD